MKIDSTDPLKVIDYFTNCFSINRNDDLIVTQWQKCSLLDYQGVLTTHGIIRKQEL